MSGQSVWLSCGLASEWEFDKASLSPTMSSDRTVPLQTRGKDIRHEQRSKILSVKTLKDVQIVEDAGESANIMKALKNFHQDLVDIYGYMVQVETAIGFWREKMKGLMGEGGIAPSTLVPFGAGDPRRPDATYQYETPMEDLIAASEKEGINYIVHHRCILVLVVASWEACYRRRIACECEIEEDDVKSDVFHDLNKYRHAILHAGGRLDSKLKVLRLFRKGDEVDLNTSQMGALFRDLIDELNRIGREYYHTDPEFTFEKRLHGPQRA